MDKYTNKVKEWLDDRFKTTDSFGVYYAHQPIYGFQAGHCEPAYFDRYIPTYQILKALSHIQFNSLLDVGGAEGYKAFLIKKNFNIEVHNSDISEEACKRCEELFNIKSSPVDVHNLSFKDNEFDIVLASEILEHVANYKTAVEELLRVAKKAVIITVPHESKEQIKLQENEIHGHINSFDLSTFDFLKTKKVNIITKKILNKDILELANRLIQSRQIDNNEHRKKILSLFFEVDDLLSLSNTEYGAIIYLIIKDTNCFFEKELIEISPIDILNFKIPLYFLEKKILSENVFEFNKKVKFDLPHETNDLQLYCDQFLENTSDIQIKGWAFIKNQSLKGCFKYIVFASKDKHYFFETFTEKRDDVSKYFNKIGELDDSGFYAFINKNDIEENEYKIGIMIKTKTSISLNYLNESYLLQRSNT